MGGNFDSLKSSILYVRGFCMLQLTVI